MNNNIESHQLPEGLIVMSKHLSVVGTIVECGVSLGDVLVVSIAVVEDDCCNAGYSGANVKSIFEGRIPILALMNASAVCLSEVTQRLACEDTHGELCHGMHGLGEAFDEVLDVCGNLSSVEELCLELCQLRCRWEFTSQE